MFDREHAAAMKVEQLLETASRLFNERGLDGASLDQIAAALGATKGALYHYFADKRELILRCYERSGVARREDSPISRSAAARTGLERGMIGLHLNVQAQVAGPSPLVPLIGFEVDRRPARARRCRSGWRSLHQRFTDIGRAGNRRRQQSPLRRRCDRARGRRHVRLDPQVAASERGRAQAGRSPTRWSTCRGCG